MRIAGPRSAHAAEIGIRVRHQRQRYEADGGQHRADRHDGPAAVAIDQAADPGRHGAGHQQRDGEAAEHEALAPAGIGGDRLAEHAQRIERRAPGDDLREPQRHHGVGRGIEHEGAPAPRRESVRPSVAPARLARFDRPGGGVIRGFARARSAHCASATKAAWCGRVRQPDIPGSEERLPRNDRPVDKENRLSARAARYVRVGTNVGAVAAGGRPAAVRPGLRRRTNAAALAAALGGLKGPMMKVAQLLATIPEALPNEYARELSQLQPQARRWGRHSSPADGGGARARLGRPVPELRAAGGGLGLAGSGPPRHRRTMGSRLRASCSIPTCSRRWRPI